jgi:hypothetical protein
MSELRIKLEGKMAKLGEVSAADVAQLILGFEKAVAQAAAVVLGKPKTTTGRYTAVIEQTARLRLISIEEGSVVPVLALPEPPSLPDMGELDFEVSTLGQTAVDSVLDAGAGEAHRPVHPLVAKALLEMSERLHIGQRYEAMTLIESRDGTRPERRVRIDKTVRECLQARVEEANILAVRPDDLTGVLFEADFEKRTARLRTPTGTVDVSFDAEHDDAIQTALRQSSTVRGDVVYDPQTQSARSVRLNEVVRGIEQLVLDVGAFWRELSLDELAAQQGTGRPIDPERLIDHEASAPERDAFMVAISELD